MRWQAGALLLLLLALVAEAQPGATAGAPHECRGEASNGWAAASLFPYLPCQHACNIFPWTAGPVPAAGEPPTAEAAALARQPTTFPHRGSYLLRLLRSCPPGNGPPGAAPSEDGELLIIPWLHCCFPVFHAAGHPAAAAPCSPQSLPQRSSTPRAAATRARCP